MKIDSLGFHSTKRTEKKKKSSDASGSVFSGLLSEANETSESAPAAPTRETTSINDVNIMLSLQEVPDDEINRKKAIKHGKLSLDVLEDLRHQLLMGNIPYSTLEKLESLVSQQRQSCSDPRLESVLNEIEVRTAVELAKLEVARQSIQD